MSKNFVLWEDEYSVKLDEIDNQHKKLISILNELYTAYMEKKHQSIIKDILAKMTNYTINHFATEEKYFKKFNYFDAEKHIEEHKVFVDQVSEFQEKYKQNSKALTFEIILFLQDWITKHIIGSDKKYIDCFLKNGVK